MLKFFAEKMWVAFAATHIFSAKNIRILYIESAKTVNKMTLNELVKLTMLWTTGPWSHLLQFAATYVLTITASITTAADNFLQSGPSCSKRR